MLADLPVDVVDLETVPAATVDVSTHVPVAYGAELDADAHLSLDLGDETALALRGDLA